MTRDETIGTLVLHGWQPFLSGSTLLGIKIAGGIFNRDSRRAITFAPPAQVQWVRLDRAAELEACEWIEIDDKALEVFGRVYDQKEVRL